VKGVLTNEGRVVLLKNERGEWELPGGKLEDEETPENCVEREIEEELNLRVTAGPVLDAWVYRIPSAGNVLVVAYGCKTGDTAPPRHSEEHQAVRLFGPDELEDIPIPDGYRRAVGTWFEHSGGGCA